MAKKKEPKERPPVPDGVKEYVNERLNVRFTIPEKVSVMEQLEYRGRIAGSKQDDIFVRHWRGAVPLIRDWTSAEINGDGYKPCEAVSDPVLLDLATETDTTVTEIVFWTSNQIAAHMQDLGKVPKNG